MAGRSLNFVVLAVFAPVLVATGILGFVLPARLSLMSGAAPYNVFHMLFGALGGGIALSRSERWIRRFNVGFGALDLYQAVASFAGWFPATWFLWRRADDVLHVAIGAALVAIGLSRATARASPPSPGRDGASPPA